MISYVEVQGGKIAYELFGEGPLVICVPSLGDLRQEYRFLTPLLVSAGYRVAVMDVRGHGESSVHWPDYSVSAVGSDMIALAKALNAGPAVLIGTSMAAGAGAWAGVEAPEWVKGLVLIGPAVHGEVSWQNRLFYSLLFTRPWGPAVWLKYYTTLYPAHKPADFDRYTAALRANLTEPGRLEAVFQMIVASKSASEERLAYVSAPALVIMGSKDPDFKAPEMEAQWVADRVRGTYHIVQDAGHYPHVEMPERTASLILPFLQSILEKREGIHAA